MTIFHPDKPVHAKPLHNGTVIYADNTCIRVKTAEMLGSGGSETIGMIFFLMGIIPFTWIWLVSNRLEYPPLVFAGVGILLILLPTILFRTKPNYLIFSRASQEIYYVKSGKRVFRFKWKEVTGKYTKVAVFTGGAVSRADILRINGMSQYGSEKSILGSIPIAVVDEEDARAQWAYFQTYMQNGAKGLQEPGTDKQEGSFLTVVKRISKWWLYDHPKSFIYAVFHPETRIQVFWSFIFIPAIPIMLFVSIFIMWIPGIATVFVNSTRTRSPLPEDIAKYTTDNKESYGTKTKFIAE